MGNTLKQKRILVAGGAGFIGSHLCDALLGQGHEVVCLDNFLTGARQNIDPLENHPGFSLVQADITDPLPSMGNFDEIYNLASAASPPKYQKDPVHTMMTGVVGTNNLLELAAANAARFLQASTSEIYGDPLVHPQPEDYLGNVNCTGPRACYDEAKRAGETLSFDYLRRGSIDARVVRIFNTYGPRMQADDGRIVSNLITQALRGEQLTIYGTGQQTRSFCYVDDLVRGIIALMQIDANPKTPVNLGNPGEFTINELADLVMARVPAAGPVVYNPLPQDDPQKRQPDISKAKTLLGWEPRVPLVEGLEPTIAYFALELGIHWMPAMNAPGEVRRTA
ncbi:UDP-glucuronic acid decarboxylase family protein [Nitratireductor basaltis]|uniref:NAD-dependent epimerase/dehydratase n=1 Tax=Nitratireductor basaltis TaxID=472175 RepID=A0A084UAT5_9HYPH|nr:UDP-glucuronic acid decarboxylase family protein [Nitratireductor basaltis]KFB10071.1 NAD-dependent epimerase/dehydratase [Nitratireductor basaltis]